MGNFPFIWLQFYLDEGQIPKTTECIPLEFKLNKNDPLFRNPTKWNLTYLTEYPAMFPYESWHFN